MKRFLLFLIILSAAVTFACADPLPLLEDYAEDMVLSVDENDPSAGTFRYSYRYPHVDGESEGGANINVFYQDLIDYTISFTIPMNRDAYEGSDASTVITYTVTCNNDDYFSVLVRTEWANPDRNLVLWEGQVVSRKNGSPGLTYTLPKLLGTLASNESDTWLQDRQTEKADNLIRQMVWEQIEDNPEGIAYDPSLTEETLAAVFFPEQDFYLDEDGNPVFYLQPGDVLADAAEGAEPVRFPLSLEDILDEL